MYSTKVNVQLIFRENTTAYEQFLLDFKNFIGENNYENPQYWIADGAMEIRSAIKKTHGDIPILMCYFHVRKNIRDNYPKESSMYHKILEMLHNSRSEMEFELILNEFKLIAADSTNFLSYFLKVWVEDKERCLWRIFDSERGVASANCGMERLNGNNFLIKGGIKSYTGHAKKTLVALLKYIDV